MTRSRLAPLSLLALACSAGTRLPRAPHGQVVLQVQGAVKGAPFRLGEEDLRELRQARVQGVEPAVGREASYEGLDLAALLDRLELTGGADTLVLRTADGRAVPVPLAVLREMHPVLAARAGGALLEARLVAWPNVSHHGLTSDPRATLWWARDVVALEYVSWLRVFGRALHVPEGAPPGALAGATAYGTRCVACHAIRGAGGTLGPGLIRAGEAPGTEKLEAALPGHRGWSAPGSAPPRPEVIGQLAAFLWTAARTPVEEAEEPPPAPPRPPPPPLPLPVTPPR